MRSVWHSLVKENSGNHKDLCAAPGCVTVRKLHNFCESCFPQLYNKTLENIFF